MAVLIDTSVLVEGERGAMTVSDLLGEEQAAVSVITVSELLHGAHRAGPSQQARRRAFVEHVLAGLDAIPITERVARVHAELWAGLAARGELVGGHDLWIAATALAHGFGLATKDERAFARVPGLRIVAAA